MINRNIVLPVNIGSGKPSFTCFSKENFKKKNKNLITFEKTPYPGFLSNINLLRKLDIRSELLNES